MPDILQEENIENLCVRCSCSEVAFTSPQDMCDACWATWWVDSILKGNQHVPPGLRDFLIKDTLECLRG